MTTFISMSSVLSILVYSIALALCFMMYGKTGEKLFQYAGVAMFVAVFGAVFAAGQTMMGLRHTTHTLVFAIMLAFNIVEIYLFARVVHAIFGKALSAAFYIWLCIIIMVNGLISPFPVDLTLWCFLAFNISVVILCIFYWESLVRERDENRHQEAAQYGRIILTLAICAIAMLAYSITNLSLFQKIISRNLVDGYYILFGLIVSFWLIGFCQKEYERYTSCSLKHAFRRQEVLPEEEAEMILETIEEDEMLSAEPLDQMERFRVRYDLTDRETEILKLILAGKSNQEISEDLFITVGTVKAHVHSIFGKLEVTRRSQLMTRFMEELDNN